MGTLTALEAPTSKGSQHSLCLPNPFPQASRYSNTITLTEKQPTASKNSANSGAVVAHAFFPSAQEA